LKIHHALKETSYLTDADSIADSAAIATSIGNYLLDCPPSGKRSEEKFRRKMISQRLFTMIAAARMMPFPSEKLKFRRPVNTRKK
jgi:hypothetical protein